jgi:hypothetical protein
MMVRSVLVHVAYRINAAAHSPLAWCCSPWAICSLGASPYGCAVGDRRLLPRLCRLDLARFAPNAPAVDRSHRSWAFRQRLRPDLLPGSGGVGQPAHHRRARWRNPMKPPPIDARVSPR